MVIWFRVPWLRREAGGCAEEPRLHIRVPRLRPTDVGHGGDGDASLQAAADDLVLGGASEDYSNSNGMSARQLEDQLGVTSDKTAWLLTQKLRRSMIDPDRDPLEGVVEVDRAEIPFREGDSFFESGNAGKILVIGAVEVIDRDTNPPQASTQARQIPRHALRPNTPRHDRRQFGGVDRSVRESQRETWSHAAD